MNIRVLMNAFGSVAVLTIGMGTAAAQWAPSGALATVPLVENCSITGGDIAVARPGPIIVYCQAAADRLNEQWPGVGNFYYAHEFGHVALQTADEAQADCWAAQQLRDARNGRQILDAAIRHFVDRQNEPVNARYGPMLQRAKRVAGCAGLPMPISPTPQMGRSARDYPKYCCTDAGVLGPYDNNSVPEGEACFGTDSRGERHEGRACYGKEVNYERLLSRAIYTRLEGKAISSYARALIDQLVKEGAERLVSDGPSEAQLKQALDNSKILADKIREEYGSIEEPGVKRVKKSLCPIYPFCRDSDN